MLSKTIFATVLMALATSVAAAPVAAPSSVGDSLTSLLSPVTGTGNDVATDASGNGDSDSAFNGNIADGNAFTGVNLTGDSLDVDPTIDVSPTISLRSIDLE